MNFRWLIFDYVDPALELTKEQRRRVRIRGLLNPPILGSVNLASVSWFAILLAALAPATGMLLGFGVFFVFFRDSWLGIPLMFAVQIASTWLLLAFIGKYTWRPLVCAELRVMGFDVCEKCGYWLRGLGEDVQQCPECGAERVFEIRDAELPPLPRREQRT